MLNAARGLDPFTIINCEPFTSNRTPQPFQIKIDSNTLMFMDVHCHLAKTEVIGYLAGRWDFNEKVLHVTQAFPCRALEGIDTLEREKTVEMDPDSEMAIRNIITDQGLSVLGWYHSHPVFKCEPSIRDILNQQNYQTLFRDSSDNEPFVGFIIAPYENSEKASQVRCFWVSQPRGEARDEATFQHGTPMLVDYELVRANTLPMQMIENVRLLLEYYENFTQRQIMSQTAYKQKNKSTVSKRNKLLSSMRSNMPSSMTAIQIDAILEFVSSSLQEADHLHELVINARRC